MTREKTGRAHQNRIFAESVMKSLKDEAEAKEISGLWKARIGIANLPPWN